MTRPLLPRQGLTLVQLLLVLAVIATLIGLSVVGVQKIRAMAAMSQCANNLKQIGLACHSANDQQKRMPPAFGFYPGGNIYGGADGLGSIFFHLLPYLDQQALYQESRYRPAPSPPTPLPGVPGRGEERQLDFFFYTANDVSKKQVELFNCPADPTLKPGVDPHTGAAPSSYAANHIVFGTVDANFASIGAQGKPRLAVTFPDGTSNTILFAEKYASASISAAANNGLAYKGGCHWAYYQANCHNPLFAYYYPGPANSTPPTDPNAVAPGHFQVQPNPVVGCNPCLPATGHTAMNVCMGDGSVRPLSADMAPSLWWSLVTPAGGETVGSD
jgi:hypothetical protein